MPKELQVSVWRKRPEFQSEKLILHHDSNPKHEALRVHKFLAKKSTTNTGYSPYFPELVPCGLWLFLKLKTAPRGQRFADNH